MTSASASANTPRPRARGGKRAGGGSRGGGAAAAGARIVNESSDETGDAESLHGLKNTLEISFFLVLYT